MDLIGRDAELRALEDLYSDSGLKTCAVYGRRRVGKTALLRRFCEGKPSLFLNAAGPDKGTILESLSHQISEHLDDDGFRLGSSEDLVAFLGSMQSEETMVVVIDGFPGLVRHFPSFPPMLRTFIDTELNGRNMMLIVCGSTASGMADYLNDEDWALSDRFALRMRLEPLPYREARKLNPGLSEEDRMRIYAIASGIPLYHSMFGSDPPEAGIKRLFIGPAPWGELEADMIASADCRSSGKYEAVLGRIRGGATFTELMESTGLARPVCAQVLKELVLLGFVRRDVCFGMKKKSVYRIDDGLLAFRFDVLKKVHGEKLSRLDADEAYGLIKKDLDAFYDSRFERICAEYIQSTERCISIGSWWGSVPQMVAGTMKRDENGKAITDEGDLDIVAVIDDGLQRLLIGECRFTDRPVGRNEVDLLKERADVIRERPADRRYIIFSRSGFSDYLRSRLEDYPDPDLKLVTMDDLEKWAEAGQMS